MSLRTQFLLLSRTSGFRLALRSLALSLAGAVLVFGIIHHAEEATWRDQIDTSVTGAQTDILSDIHIDKQSLPENVRETVAEGGGLFYAAIGPDGTWLAGNLRTSRPTTLNWTGFKTLHRGEGFILPPRVMGIRGIVQRFPDGNSLIIAADASALLALNKLIARSFLTIFGTILALGLLSGYLAARSTLVRVDAFATAIRDITDGDLSRRLDVGRAGDEFDRLAVRLNRMLQRLQELMDNLRQVTNDISHDLRSPLARLREHLERSKSRFTGPGLEEMFDEAVAQIDQALEIFCAMLQIAEIEAGARRARFAPVSVSSLLTMLAESYEPSLALAGISIETDIRPQLTVHGDRELLAQLVANLLDNILLHGSGTSIVTIRAVRVADQVKFSISDNGCGIPSDQRGQVVQRFIRLDASRHQPGHGLGLSVAQAVVGLHGGKMGLDENMPGLTVNITIPAKSVGT